MEDDQMNIENNIEEERQQEHQEQEEQQEEQEEQVEEKETDQNLLEQNNNNNDNDIDNDIEINDISDRNNNNLNNPPRNPIENEYINNNESNNHHSTNHDLDYQPQDNQINEEKKTNQELIENLSNDSFNKKFEKLREKLFNRPGKITTPEDRDRVVNIGNLNLNMTIKTISGNPKLEEIFAMIEAKDIKRELKELNKRPEDDSKYSRIQIQNIHNYSPLKEKRQFSQGRNMGGVSAGFGKNSIGMKRDFVGEIAPYEKFKCNVKSVFREGNEIRKDKRIPSPVVIERIVPKKRDVMFTKDYFRNELSSLNKKLFGDQPMKGGRKGYNNTKDFYF